MASGVVQAERAPAVTDQCPRDITHPAAAVPHPLVGWGRGSPPQGATPNPAPAPRDPEGDREGAVRGPWRDQTAPPRHLHPNVEAAPAQARPGPPQGGGGCGRWAGVRRTLAAYGGGLSGQPELPAGAVPRVLRAGCCGHRPWPVRGNVPV